MKVKVGTKITGLPKDVVASHMANLLTTKKSPTNKLGIIEPVGILNGLKNSELKTRKPIINLVRLFVSRQNFSRF